MELNFLKWELCYDGTSLYVMMIRYDGTLSCDTVICSDFILCVDSLSNVLSTPCLSYEAT